MIVFFLFVLTVSRNDDIIYCERGVFVSYEINKRITQIRKHLHLSQEEFGIRLGVSRSVINNIDRCNVYAESKPIFIDHICSVYRVNKEWLILGTGDMFQSLHRDTHINKRIKSIRNSLGLSQSVFAASLGLGRGTIKGWDEGTTEPTDIALRHLCAVYSVNYEWITTGNGNMFVEAITEDVLSDFFDDLSRDSDNSFRKRFILALSKFDCDDWATVEKFLDNFTKTEKDGE